MFWYEDKPELLKDITDSLTAAHQPIQLKMSGHRYVLVGIWEVRHGDTVLDSYRIKIVFPDDYPIGLPSVFELEGKIPRSKDRHLTPHRDWEACLFVSCARWEIWPRGSSFGLFLNGPINDFFLAQSYYEEYGKWPYGDYKHGTDGKVQYFMDKLGTQDKGKVLRLVEIILLGKTPSNERCPCGSKNKIAECHGQQIEMLRTNVDRDELDDVKSHLSPTKIKTKNVFRRNGFRKFFR